MLLAVEVAGFRSERFRREVSLFGHLPSAKLGLKRDIGLILWNFCVVAMTLPDYVLAQKQMMNQNSTKKNNWLGTSLNWTRETHKNTISPTKSVDQGEV